MAAALGNLSTLAGSNITAETSNCSTPEVTCAWHVTFVEFYGDAELLTANVDELGGNAADVTVIDEVQGQDTLNIDGSPVMVRVGNIVFVTFLSSICLGTATGRLRVFSAVKHAAGRVQKHMKHDRRKI